MDETTTFHIYQNGIVLGEFTGKAIQIGLKNGTFFQDDWGCAMAGQEWQPLGKLANTVSEWKSEGKKGDTRVLPDLQIRPAAKVVNKNILSRSMRLHPKFERQVG